MTVNHKVYHPEREPALMSPACGQPCPQPAALFPSTYPFSIPVSRVLCILTSLKICVFAFFFFSFLHSFFFPVSASLSLILYAGRNV